MKKIHSTFWVFALLTAILASLLTSSKTAYFFGFFISLTNALLAWFFYRWHRGKVPLYSGQSLATVISTTITRFVVVGSLLVYSFKWLGLTPEPLLLGFVLGQLLFLLNQFFMVTTNYGK